MLWIKLNIDKINEQFPRKVKFAENLQWSELLAPLVNMTKEGCENKNALSILLIFSQFTKIEL